MGAADVVPGVSGGTMAVVLGIYERLLGSLRAMAEAGGLLLRGVVGRRGRTWRMGAAQRLGRVDWLLVITVPVGILCSVVGLASVIRAQLEARPETMAGLFCGLVGASALAAGRLYHWRHLGRLLVTAGVAGTTFALLGLRAGPVEDPSPLVLLAAGAVAVCAMVLPGISGAFVLLMVGMYTAVINIVDQRLWADAAAVGFGALVGLALFSTLLGRLLDRARHLVMATMVGLMAGSIRVLWPWPNGIGAIDHHEGTDIASTDLAWPTADSWLAPTVAAAVGFAVVLALVHLGSSSRLPGNTRPATAEAGPQHSTAGDEHGGAQAHLPDQP